MKHKINPIVDCVFKMLLGSEKNKNLLIHFLNAVTGLQGDETITDVVILNPYNDRQFPDDKLSIVDIKAKCQNGFKYQVEIQLSVHPALSSRILYNWSTIYNSMIKKKQDYMELKPVISIWILDSSLFPDASTYHLTFGINDLKNNISLTDHLKIHLLQLSMFDEYKEVSNEKDRWLYFFKRAEDQDIDNLPDVMQTKEMKQAMETLQDFSESERNYLLYQSRVNAQLEFNTWKSIIRQSEEEARKALGELKQERRAKLKAFKERKKALDAETMERKEKEKALQEKNIYLKILKEQGIDISTLDFKKESDSE